MLQQKRIRKKPEPLVLQYSHPPRKPKEPRKKRKLKRCSYQTIPLPTKYVYSTKTYCIFADIVILEHERNIVFEPSLLNRFMRIEEIKVTGEPGNKLITVKIEKREETKVFPWNQIVRTLKVSRHPVLLEWAKILSDFSTKYEKVFETTDELTEEGPKTPKASVSDVHHHKEQKSQLYETYPCIGLQFKNKQGKQGLSHVTFSESFISELDYTLDTFAGILLQDGIPQMMPYEGQGNSQILKTLLEHYFWEDQESWTSEQFSSYILTKNGHIKDVVLQAYYFPCISDEKAGIDIVVTFIKIGDFHYQDTGKQIKSRINHNSLPRTTGVLKEKHYFLAEYYNESMPLHLAYPDKVCRVKNICSSDDESFDVKIEVTKAEGL